MENTKIENLSIELPEDVGYVLTDDCDKENVDFGDVEKHLEEDEYGLKPIMVAKKTTYTQAHRRAQQKYREKFPEKYCELQRKLYNDKKDDEEWKKKFNERSKMNNKKFRDRKNQEIIDAGGEIRKRGRPKKIKNIEIIPLDENNIDEKKVEVLDVLYSA